MSHFPRINFRAQHITLFSVRLPREPDPTHALDGSGAGETLDSTPTLSHRAERSARVGDLSEWCAQRATGR